MGLSLLIDWCFRLPCRVSFEEIGDGRWLLVNDLVPAVRNDLDRHVAPTVIAQGSSDGGIERCHRMFATCEHDRHVDRVAVVRVESFIRRIRAVEFEPGAKLRRQGV